MIDLSKVTAFELAMALQIAVRERADMNFLANNATAPLNAKYASFIPGLDARVGAYWMELVRRDAAVGIDTSPADSKEGIEP